MNQRGKILNATQRTDAKYMKLALKAAENARGICSPNPFVGAVVVKDGKVMAEGWTQKCGGDHAEVQALAKAGKQARGADLYVTLEPCSHFGKTPPCTEAIISAGIKRVVFGLLDPNPLVNGKGMLRLQEVGVEAVPGIMKPEISRQLEYYLCRMQKHRPFVIWKTALSLDGKYAAQDGSSRWISSEKSRALVHQLRSEVDVVLTGIGTVLADDPQLNVRLRNPLKQPLRAVLDPKLQLSLDSRVVAGQGSNPTLVFCARGRDRSPKAEILMQQGVSIHPVTASGNNLNLREILGILHQQGHYAILLECGSKLASAFFSARLVDKCHIFYGAKILGGKKAALLEFDIPTISSALALEDVSCEALGNDLLVRAYPVF
ncbi:MAG: bifunctional diaminohydroxyphosphoribosylaminopyrimidine deaminase/5-amino-6-(5-phosphoribosylamino)uracil reductase RibD [Candidatus Syntrophosphaera sp.]|nr:bifunctional diaminohydroxyphosphoribosylaminopyrimidine deaminase/5-amino-6-(5-phosphoribosylamino)uracil reductase RibD [Candidatus Syntrophosphaera sp.]